MTSDTEDPIIKIKVNCYSGSRGEESPRKIRVWEKELEVKEELDRWLGPDYRYFKVRCSDEAVYIIRHDEKEDLWELTYFSKKELS